MSHIDLTSADLAAVIARASRDPGMSPAPALLVSPEVFAVLKVETVDGHAYLGPWPVVADLKADPPPRPVVVADMTPADVAERTAELQQVIRSHVDQHLPPSEREGLAALLQRCTLMKGMGIPVDDGALLALLASLGWAEGAMMLGAEVATACRACTTLAELQAVAVDLGVLGAPPVVSAGQIALALRGG